MDSIGLALQMNREPISSRASFLLFQKSVTLTSTAQVNSKRFSLERYLPKLHLYLFTEEFHSLTQLSQVLDSSKDSQVIFKLLHDPSVLATATFLIKSE